MGRLLTWGVLGVQSPAVWGPQMPGCVWGSPAVTVALHHRGPQWPGCAVGSPTVTIARCQVVFIFQVCFSGKYFFSR
ncbi:hypothetical protein INR49_020968 [Caranx melampygus]|nr:hypothetical protein INR49_020968 [Caranx melampygus]